MEFLVGLAAIGLVFRSFFRSYSRASSNTIGDEGEQRVSATLSRRLPPQDNITLGDLTLPTAQGTTQIDHIVLSRSGVFVIETKNMSGWIFGDARQARWTQILPGHKAQFQNPLRQNYHHVKVVQDLLGLRRDQLENLVVFVGSAEPRTEMPPNVFWDMDDLFLYIASQKAVHFTESDLQGFAQKLRAKALGGGQETRDAHVQHLREKAFRKEHDLASCPRCGAALIARTNRQTGQSFYGCSRYPKCRGTRQTVSSAAS